MLKKTVFCLFVIICAVWSDDVHESRIVDTAQGPVRGYKDPETGIYSFQSIPYATAPTGANRFKAPLPPPVWMNPLEAIDREIICPQMPCELVGSKKMQENCLIVNVYTPDIEAKNLPVVIYVHGGAFQIGYGDLLVPKKLMIEHNVITVTINYRLGTHGFLCLGTEDIPGNAGMKDIVAGLRWVQKNIANFGGEPDEVTIAGYSAGAAAVDLLMLSRSAEGLFNKVIPESGSSIATWTIQSDPIENAKSYAKRLNFTDVDDINALEDFYKNLPYDLLFSISEIDRKDTVFGMSPCIERDLGKEVFLDQSPVDILKSGNYKKVPLLYGFANMEGLMRISLFDMWKEDMNVNFGAFIPADLKFESEDQKESVAKQIKEFYFGNEPVSGGNTIGYVDFLTDVTFAFPALRSVKYHVEAGHDKIFMYLYSYVDENTPFVQNTNIKGADHGTQVIAVFNEIPGLVGKSNFTEEFKQIAVKVRKFWGNFIKTGNPVTDGSPVEAWPSVGAGWTPHMEIANKIQLQGPLLERRMAFWDEIYSKYYRDPIPPTPLPTKHTEL